VLPRQLQVIGGQRRRCHCSGKKGCAEQQIAAVQHGRHPLWAVFRWITIARKHRQLVAPAQTQVGFLRFSKLALWAIGGF
jgi:hypothetical protein